ncbi:hypothetical protein [Nocardia sp. NPDC020380]|uniref:hypothetical protein n=1 Tax=Nocardia sp. NPDC020380 TaxID=3364309 RepID=UPI00378A913D
MLETNRLMAHPCFAGRYAPVVDLEKRLTGLSVGSRVVASEGLRFHRSDEIGDAGAVDAPAVHAAEFDEVEYAVDADIGGDHGAAVGE